MDKKIHFEGYVKSYLNRYFKENNIREDFNIDFYDYLLNQILSISAKTILTLFYVFKKENLLEGNTSEQRYEYFDDYSKTDEFHNLVNRMYPILNLRLDKVIYNHLINYEDLTERIEKDRIELLDKFGVNIDNIRDCHIHYGVSDDHRGSKTVCIIEKDDKKIVYKPRSGKVDKYWELFINWLNSKEPSLKLKVNKTLDKGEYHWQEYIDNEPCKSKTEIKMLYYRIGILAAISYILKIEDLHMENIIVNEDFPYIVDLEAIFQLDGFQNEGFKIRSATDLINKEIRQSVLSTQLFPVPSKFYDSNIDISGITGRGGQRIKSGRVETINKFTDKIEVIRRDSITKSKSNIGRTTEYLANPKDYIKDIIEGFEEGYRLIQANKEELLTLLNTKRLFSNVYPRYLFRNTNLYSIILETSKNPKYLKDETDLVRLYNLLINNSNNYNFKEVYQSEITDLCNDDIPYFYGHIDDLTIYNSNEKSCFVLDRTPLSEVSRRIKGLSQKDMYAQIGFISKSMAKHNKTWNTVKKKVDHSIVKDICSKKLLIQAAREIGDILIRKATIDEDTGTINWLDLQNTFPTWTIKAQDPFLYSGLAGNAIFFSSLYVVTKDIRYQKTLEKILNTIKVDLSGMKSNSTSVFNGAISLVYLYAYLYNQRKDENMLQEGLNILNQYKEMIYKNTSYDIIDGLAGILVVTLNIYCLSKNKDLKDLSVEIGKDIVKNIKIKNGSAYWVKGNKKELMIAGFAHGLAGITYALGKLSRETNNNKYRALIRELIKIENKYYSNDIKNWIDLRSEDKPNLDKSPIHWCHGAVGIGLSRLKNKDILDTSRDVDKTLKTVIENGLYRDSDCLCHGNLGNIELLLQVHMDNGNLDLYNKAITRTSQIIRKKGYRNGVGQEFNSPNFILGLSGIGYELIRLSDSEKYPSVLLLEV